MKFTLAGAIGLLLVSASAGAGVAPRQDQDHPPLDLHTIPISAWLNSGEHSDIPWSFRVRDPFLRIDQYIEVSYTADIQAKDLNRTGSDHELFLISRVSSPDGEWLNETGIVHNTVETELPKNAHLEFRMDLCVQPGEYLLWVVLYDRKTGKHNLAKHRLHISELRGDPLPDLYRRMPLVEFPDASDSSDTGGGFVNSRLYLPVRNKRPLQIELVSMLSPPEQWAGRSRIVRVHNDDTLGAIAALSQIELTDGTISISGLDLVRRQVMFEQRAIRSVNWTSLVEAMKKAQLPAVSAKDLQGAKNDAAFFREILNERLTSDPAERDPLRVIVVVTSARLFESGSDLQPLQIEGDCHCRIYYLRFRLTVNDVFDQLDKLMKPLRPRIFNLLSARDLRKAIADIVEDLGKL
jgi:hypothetical protein